MMCLDNLDYLPEIVEKTEWIVSWKELVLSLKDYIDSTKLLDIIHQIKK